MPTYRDWCATFFEEPKLDANYRYMIVGEEKCPETGRLHWQCYIEFENKVSMKHIKAEFEDKTVHLEPKRGTREQARDYCKKEGKWTEHGVWAEGPGFRTDLAVLTKQILEGSKRTSDIMLEEPATYCKYRQGMRDIQQLADKRNTGSFRQVEVKVYSGPTGCGKTQRAYGDGQNTYKITGDDLAWFDGYDGEEHLLIDEYDQQVPITRLLTLLDGYQLRLPVKGGFTYARWTRVSITTNLKRPEVHAKAKEEHRNALNRRISEWISLWQKGPRCSMGNTEPSSTLPDEEEDSSLGGEDPASLRDAGRPYSLADWRPAGASWKGGSSSARPAPPGARTSRTSPAPQKKIEDDLSSDEDSADAVGLVIDEVLTDDSSSGEASGCALAEDDRVESGSSGVVPNGIRIVCVDVDSG